MSRWKQGDTKPDMTVDCFEGNGQRAPLQDAATVRVLVSKQGIPVWEREIENASNGVVVVPLQASDVAIPGTYFVKVYAEWPDGSRQHYPPADEYMTMTVTR